MIASMNTTNTTFAPNLAVLTTEAAIAATRVINEVLREVDPNGQPLDLPALDPRIETLGATKSAVFVLVTAIPLLSLVLRAGFGRAMLPIFLRLRRLQTTHR